MPCSEMPSTALGAMPALSSALWITACCAGPLGALKQQQTKGVACQSLTTVKLCDSMLLDKPHVQCQYG